ncbi:MAG TPA: cobalt ECF transporter T component CbiQ, partial [Kribbella sp.]
AKLPGATVVRRLAVETPFLMFALLLPFVATGPRVDVLGLSLSVSGVLGSWNVLAKGTLGVLAAIVLSASTAPRELLAGLERLRLPSTLVAILSFMVRYLSVVSGDLQRMRIARESRGYTGGRAGHLKAVAAGAGALFVRSFERGERVHLAMQARGYTGTMPVLSRTGAARAQWLEGLALSLAAVVIAILARIIGR